MQDLLKWFSHRPWSRNSSGSQRSPDPSQRCRPARNLLWLCAFLLTQQRPRQKMAASRRPWRVSCGALTIPLRGVEVSLLITLPASAFKEPVELGAELLEHLVHNRVTDWGWHRAHLVSS